MAQPWKYKTYRRRADHSLHPRDPAVLHLLDKAVALRRAVQFLAGQFHEDVQMFETLGFGTLGAIHLTLLEAVTVVQCFEHVHLLLPLSYQKVGHLLYGRRLTEQIALKSLPGGRNLGESMVCASGSFSANGARPNSRIPRRSLQRGTCFGRALA
jgi:hypothetical protein